MRQFGELEAVIMDRLWAWGRPASVREMVDGLQNGRQIAYRTVMTIARADAGRVALALGRIQPM